MVVHRRIRELDLGGSWDRAVTTATGTELGTSNQTFAEFDQLASAAIDTSGQRAVSSFGGHNIGLTIVSILTLLLSIAAAVWGVRGINARRKEYL